MWIGDIEHLRLNSRRSNEINSKRRGEFSYLERTPNCAKLRYGKSALDTPPFRTLLCTMEVFGWTDTVVCNGENTLVFTNGLEITERLFNVVVAKHQYQDICELFLFFRILHCVSL